MIRRLAFILITLFVGGGCGGADPAPAPPASVAPAAQPAAAEGHDHAAAGGHDHAAAEGHDHAAGGHDHAAAGGHDHAAAEGHDHAAGGHEHAASPRPASYADALVALTTQARTMRAQVTGGDLKAVHGLSEAIGSIAVLLPGLATELTPEARSKATTGALGLKKTADKLHHAADEGNVSEVTPLLDALDAAIAALPSA